MLWLKILIMVAAVGMVVSIGVYFMAEAAISKICAEKKASGDWAEGERDICRRHGHL